MEENFMNIPLAFTFTEQYSAAKTARSPSTAKNNIDNNFPCSKQNVFSRKRFSNSLRSQTPKNSLIHILPPRKAKKNTYYANGVHYTQASESRHRCIGLGALLQQVSLIPTSAELLSVYSRLLGGKTAWRKLLLLQRKFKGQSAKADGQREKAPEKKTKLTRSRPRLAFSMQHISRAYVLRVYT